MKVTLVGIFLVLLAGLVLLGLHALVPCNRYWPQLDYCRLTQQTDNAEREAESDRPGNDPEPPCYFDREPACDENGNPELDPNLLVECTGAVCYQSGRGEVTAPAQGQGCQGTEGMGSWLSIPSEWNSGSGYYCTAGSSAAPPD